ncbi:TonB-dependent receptor [Pedobacter sp. ASV1-7]|uniref:SusC/RagA family TonB-linked outer membrane protein n=1 Tax=Pedobacter sp. ASV1-7 TaxID=3145237 RepID=UPI0032E929A5
MQLNVYGKIRILSGIFPSKLFLAMKLTIALLILGCLQINAKSFSQTITLTGNNISLEKALISIGEQSGYYFFYKYTEIVNAKPLNLNLKGVSLQKALAESFKNQPFSYTIDSKTIIVKGIEDRPSKKTATEIKGKVIDEKGQPLPGAVIKVKGSNKVTATDGKGNFLLESISETAILVISYTGYVSQEISVVGKSSIEIVLKEDNQSLNTVVVVGYGTQQRKDITGAISSMSSQKIKDQPVVSIDQAMAGQMSGVQVTQATGAPGGGATVRIRGAGSLSAGNEPLYVVDGFPVTNDYNQRNNPLNSINPADIDNIQVLKDASATAIYGSRGSNGVVIITTKSGKSGISKVDFSINTGLQQVEKTLDVLNAKEFAVYINEARNNAWVNSGPNRLPTDPNNIRNNVMYNLPAVFADPESLGVGTNWQNEIFRTAPMSNYQINFSGGNDKTKYFLSGGYLTQDGVVLNTDLKRYTFRVNVESQVNKSIKVGANITPSYSTSNQGLVEGNWQGGGIIQSALTAAPHLSPYDANGSYTKITGQGIGTSEVDNPVKIAKEYFHKQNTLRLLGTAFVDVNILNDLNFKTLVGVDLKNFDQDIFNPSIINPNSVNATKLPTGTYEDASSRNWLSEFTLNYKKQFGEHRFDVLGGYTIQKENTDLTILNGTNYANDLVKTVNAAGLVTTGANSGPQEWSLLSYLARLNYSYNDKYLLTATFRRDGSSRFGGDNKWGSFPSISIGWRISEESFLKNLNWLSELRVRSSYGLTGNNFITNYGAIGLTGIENYVFGASGGSVTNGIKLINIENSLLGWERNKQLDLGLEMGLFQSRLSMSFDYYNKTTSDLLLNVPVPTLTGYSNALRNIGEIKNKGFEFSLTSRNMIKEFKWTTDFNLSTNNIKVSALGPDGSPILARQITFAAGSTHITQIGSAPGSFYGYKVIGVYQNAAEVANSAALQDAAGNKTSKPGQLKFADVDGDGIITANDRTTIGSPFPEFTYGMTNSFFYKNFDFAFTLQGVQGFEVLNAARRFYGNYAGTYNVLSSTANGWKSESDRGNGVSPQIDRNFGAVGVSSVINSVTSQFVEDGSFLRIRNITLGYNLPSSMLKTLKVANARLSLTVQNAFTFTNYEGYNPEVSVEGGNPLVPGVDSGGYPLARTFMFGLNFGF